MLVALTEVLFDLSMVSAHKQQLINISLQVGKKIKPE